MYICVGVHTTHVHTYTRKCMYTRAPMNIIYHGVINYDI